MATQVLDADGHAACIGDVVMCLHDEFGIQAGDLFPVLMVFPGNWDGIYVKPAPGKGTLIGSGQFRIVSRSAEENHA